VADPLSKILLGLLTGLLFGFFLQKAHVTKRDVIVGQFRLRDFTVMKTMLTAICVGGIGVYLLKTMGLAQLHVKPAQLGAVVLGGLIFGVGMVVLGYCPGTGVAAAAEGKKDAWFGVLGMMAGALIFAEIYAPLQDTLMKVWDFGPVTLPEITHAPAWAIFGLLSIGAYFLFRWLTAWEQRRQG
jgi:uncharacterized protein